MHVLAKLVVVFAVVAAVESAATVRFVNMVPAKRAFTALRQVGAIASFNRDVPGSNPLTAGSTWLQNQWARFPNQHKSRVNTLYADRVGLEYFPTGLDGSVGLQESTVVWTENFASMQKIQALYNTALQTDNNGRHLAPFYYEHALPPLRGYHAFLDAAGDEAAATDRLSNSFDTTTGNEGLPDSNNAGGENGNCGAQPASFDCYEHSALKADGIAGTLSFAAGTYQLQAYGSVGATSALTAGSVHRAQTRSEFSGSQTSFTFEDGKFYTIVAVGSWATGTTTAALNASPVKLVLLEESTAPTTFGKAAIRFFNGLSTHQSASVDIHKEEVGGSIPLVTKLQYATQSQYIDVAPGSPVFPIAQNQDGILSTLANSLAVTAKLPAGARVTSFCGVTDQENKIVFCRMIPTRVVAYVRLVLDTANLPVTVAGKFGPQKLGETSISVWQSIDYALPETSADQFALQPSNLHEVIPATLPGTVTGYGEAHIPLFIMDSANSPTIGFSCYNDQVAAGVWTDARVSLGCSNTISTYSTLNANRYFGTQQGAVADASVAATGSLMSLSTFKFSARFKRVNLYVKTDGMATLAIRQVTAETGAATFAKMAPDQYGDNLNWAQSGAARVVSDDIVVNPHFGFIDVDGISNAGAFVDRFMEPGEYYSMYIKACDRKFQAPGRLNNIQITCPYLDMSIANAIDGLPTLMPAPGALLAGWSRDQSVPETSAAPSTGNAKIQITPFDAQDFQGTITFTASSTALSSSGYERTITLPAHDKHYNDGVGINNAAGRMTGYTDSGRNTIPDKRQGAQSVVDCTDCAPEQSKDRQAMDVILPDMNTWESIPAGTYSFTFASALPAPAVVADSCVQYIPSSTTVTFEAGERYTLYVLNEYACSIETQPETSKLTFVAAKTRPIHMQPKKVTPSGFSSASSQSSTLALLIAAVVAVLALVC